MTWWVATTTPMRKGSKDIWNVPKVESGEHGLTLPHSSQQYLSDCKVLLGRVAREEHNEPYTFLS